MNKLRFKIKQHRKRLGYTLEELADKVGSSKSYIWELENKTLNPGAYVLLQLADTLGVSVDYLLRDDLKYGDSYLDSCIASLATVLGTIDSILEEIRPMIKSNVEENSDE